MATTNIILCNGKYTPVEDGFIVEILRQGVGARRLYRLEFSSSAGQSQECDLFDLRRKLAGPAPLRPNGRRAKRERRRAAFAAARSIVGNVRPNDEHDPEL